MPRLQVEPELGRGAEVARQAQGRVRGDGAATEGNLVEAGAGHLDGVGQLVDAQTHRLQEFLAQDFARVDRRQAAARGDVGKIDPVLVEILAADGHDLAPQW